MPEVIDPPKPVPATPAAPSVPAPSPAPSPVPPANSDDPFGGLQTSIKPTAPSASPPAPKPGDKPAQPAPAPTPASDKTGPQELRAELKRVKGELESKNKAQSDLEAKIRDYESRGKDTTALVDQMTARDKQIEQLQSELRAAKHETSAEFKARFDKPFDRLSGIATQDIQSMQVLDANQTPVRPGTFSDLNKIWLTYKENTMAGIEQAESMFGERGARILEHHLERLKVLDMERTDALAEERENWKKRDEEERSKAVVNRENISRIQKQAEQELADTVAEYHDPPEDKESSTIRAQGYQIFDTRPQSFQQHVIKQAHIRHAFAALGPMKLKLMRVEQERDALKTKVEELEGKSPGGGSKRSPGEKAPASNLSWEDEARKELGIGA